MMNPWQPYFFPFFGMLMGFAGMVITAWVIYIIVDGYRRRQQVRANAEFQARLLERVGSAQEFGEFLNSESGTRFLASMTPREGGASARILGALQSGTVALFIGAAVFIFTGANPLDPGLQALLNFVASIAVAVGLALLVSAVMSLRLSRRFGLMNRGSAGQPQDTTRSV